MRHDLPQLLSLLATTPGPCLGKPPEPHALLPPVCPEGSPDGTLVPALVWGSPLEIVFIAPSQTEPLQQFTAQTFADHLIGVATWTSRPLGFVAFFGADRVAWLGFDSDGRLIGVGGGASIPASFIRAQTTTTEWLLGPDWNDQQQP